MIVVDTNVLSSFLKVDALDWLHQALHVSQLRVPSAVWLELEAAVARGHISADEWQTLIGSQRVQAITLTDAEQAQTEQLPFSLGAGEKEAIVLTKRLSATFLSNDRRALSYCRAQRVPCADLNALLRSLWVENVISPEQVRQLMRRMTDREGITFKDAEKIFLP